MNGAEALLQTLMAAGVDVCFANPGTSEMQLVAAMDTSPGMRPILALFEGVATGAADGYGRMAGKPAATLLHLGPGLANGMANLHNAQRARSPIVNIVGDHASDHLQYDTPLTTDLEGHVKLQAHWYRFASSAQTLAADGAEAVQAAMEGAGKIASLVVPADYAWSEGGEMAAPLPLSTRETVDTRIITEAAEVIKSGEPTALLLGADALCEQGLIAAGKIEAATGVKLLCETFPARLQRGAGRVTPERMPYLAEMAVETLKPFKHIILVGSKAPVSFFAYPNQPSWLSPQGSELRALALPDQDVDGALQALVDELDANHHQPLLQPQICPEIPSGALTLEAVAACVATLMPAQAIVSDESNTGVLALYPATTGAQPHDWLTLTGGAIGQGLPVAVGAGVACPDRKVINLQADGSAMYTVQSLWTMARENLDVTVVILNNKSYAILNFELLRVGVENPGEKALSILDLSRPELDWVQIASGMGMNAGRASTVEEFHSQFAAAMFNKGPYLIDALVG